MPIEGTKRPVLLQADGVLKIGLPDHTRKNAQELDSLHMDATANIWAASKSLPSCPTRS